MVITHGRSKRKKTGSRYKDVLSKRMHAKGNKPVFTKLGNRKLKSVRTIGGNIKTKLLSSDYVNLYNPKERKHIKAKITGIMENPANRHFVRRNIMTKGAVIDTDKGKAKITNRPGQEGTVNAVLV